MQSGQYIIDRWMISMIREICEGLGIEFKSYSDDWLLELTKLGKTARILGYKFSLNDAVASAIAQDKVAAYQILNTYGIPAVTHRLLRTKAGSSQQAVDWQRGIVIKPLTGTSGHGVHLANNAAEAGEIIDNSGIEAWAISPFVAIRQELRLILLDSRVLLAYEKHPVTIEGLRMFNLGKGATARDIDPSSSQVALAQDAQRALGLRLSAVDIVILADGQELVLEVNDGIMMENYARQSKANKQRAAEVYAAIVEAIMA